MNSANPAGTYRLPPDLHERLQQEAYRQDIPVSVLVTEAVELRLARDAAELAKLHEHLVVTHMRRSHMPSGPERDPWSRRHYPTLENDMCPWPEAPPRQHPHWCVLSENIRIRKLGTNQWRWELLNDEGQQLDKGPTWNNIQEAEQNISWVQTVNRYIREIRIARLGDVPHAYARDVTDLVEHMQHFHHRPLTSSPGVEQWLPAVHKELHRNMGEQL